MANLDGSSTAEIDAPLDQVWAVVEDVVVSNVSMFVADT